MGGREGEMTIIHILIGVFIFIQCIFIVGPMPSEIGTRISLTRYVLISCIFIQVHHHHFIS